MCIRNQKGVALATVLLFSIVLISLGIALTTIAMNSHLQALREERIQKAFYVARAGADALESYIVDNPGKLTGTAMLAFVDGIIAKSPSAETVFGEGTFKVSVSKSADGKTLEILSTGTVSGVSKSVTRTVGIGESGPGGPIIDMAVFSTKQRDRRFHYDKKGNIVYDEPAEAISLDGSAYIKGPVGTNSIENATVKFDWSTKVYGDVNIGPNGAIGSAVTAPSNIGDYIISPGTRKVLPKKREYPLPAFPVFPALTSKGTYTAAWNPAPPYTLALAEGDAWYSLIDVTSTLRIEVGSGVRRLRVDTLKVTGSGQIIIVGSGRLELYVTNLNIANSGKINDLGNPGKVHIYYNGTTTVNLGGDTRYYGSIYIKEADLNIGNSGGIQGHIITGGKTVNITGDATAVVKTIYAPDAHVYMGGSGKVKGSIIANSFLIDGGSWVEFVLPDNPIPDLPIGGASEPTFVSGRWK